MCGIAGIFRFNGISQLDRRVIYDMTEAIRHRGPDDSGVFLGENNSSKIAIGNRRLSIIDLSLAGHQPMSDATRNYHIVFNGEIYNFKELKAMLLNKGWHFNSSTDTEVLLYLYIEYGASCLSMVEGMFAFAIWNKKEEELFVARDRMGKKPFFYFLDDKKFIFASEIKSLFTHPDVQAELNREMLFTYFNLRYIPAPNTLFKHIYKLPPASYGSIKNNKLTIRSFWDIQPKIRLRADYSIEDYENEFVGLLKSAVIKRLISDVPFGVFLSGGVDSSTIVFIMHEILGSGIKTYSVGFDRFQDELKFAGMVAKRFNTTHKEFCVTPQDFTSGLDNLIQRRDLPVSEPADVPIYIMSRYASSEIKVVLSGEGSDELLGGYYKYFIERYSRYFRAMPTFIKYLLYKLVKAIPIDFGNIGHYIEISNIENDLTRSFMWFSCLTQDKITTLLNKDLMSDLKLPYEQTIALNLLGYKDFEAIEYLDIKYWLPDNLLERADRITMANSIELRAPFLDQNLVEFCFALPENEKIRRFLTKVILKKIMQEKLPEPILHRSKIGFTTPFKHWIKDELKTWIADIIFSEGASRSGTFNQAALKQIFEEHISGKTDNAKMLWTVASFVLWYNKCFVKGDINEN